MDRVTGLLNGEANIVALHGPRGTGKLSFLTLTYQQLVSHRQPMESSAVFVLDEWDHRSEPVSAILRSIILQLLSCEPELVHLVQPPVLDDTKDTMARQTEGNLWIQLRLIVRITKCKRMTIAINSIDSCAGKDYRGFLKALFDLQLMASSRLKILCTTETDAMNLVDSNALGMVSLNVQDLPGLKTAKAAFQTRLAHNLVSMSRFEAIKDEVAACLAKSESFLHASLIAHRIRLVESLSSPVHVRRELDGLGTNLEKTVLGIVATCPPWVRTAVAWILFAQRPLKTEELAVAVALHSWPVVWTATSLVVADFIPRDMAGDVKRRLGPLVVARNGCVRLAHGSISAIVQNWLKKSKDQEAVQNASLTQQLVAYLRNCLDQIPVGETWRELRGPRFGLLCYAFHHWHEHYSSAMGRIVPPLAPSSALVQVHDIAFTLFTNNNYRRHLWSSHQNATGHNIEESAPPGLESPVLLAARFGLLDIVVRLMNESDSPRPTGDTNKPEDPEERTVSDSSGKNGSSEVVDVFHVACLFGFRAMAEHFLDRIVDTTVLARELALACLRGNETIFQTTMTHYRHVLGCKDLPPELLLNACLAGHASLAETLLSWGANPNVPADRPPVHQAVDRGHLEVVNVLLKYKADVMAAFPDKSTPLHHSIDHGHRDISLRLLQEPGIQDTPDKQGVTALHLAAEKGDVCIIQHLLDLERPITSEARHMEGNTESTDEESSTTPSDSPLHRAAAHGHLEAVKVLLERGYHVDEPDSEGRSVLYSALCHGHRDVADHFLRYLSDQRDKVKITFGNTYAESELKQAIRQGNVTAVKQLLRLGANPNGSDESDSSPLADAVKADHSVIVSILLEHSASMTQTVDFGRNEAILGETIWDGWLPHHFAAYYGSVNVMEALNAALPSGLVGARTRSGHTPLHLAVFREHSQIVENMLARHKGVTAGTGDPAGLDDPGSWVLERKDSWRRSALDARGVLRSGLESGLSSILDIDSHTEEGITALHIAAAGGNVHLAKQLVASGALPELANKSGKRAIHYAAGAEKNADSMVQLLLQAGAEVQPRDSEGMTPLHVAASGSDESHRIAVLLLLREGADPNKVSHDGLSPLVLAASAGSVAVVRYLVQYGADVNVRVNNDGYTALHAAVSSGKTESIRILAEAGAELDVADDTGDTPLHEAARSGNIDAATILIQFGAPLNATNTRRMTALHRVVLNAFIKMAELLLDSGADPNIPDEDGDTTLTAATVAEEPAMVNLLLIPKYKTKVDVMNSAGQTPLMLALRSPGQLLPPLLSAKADVQQCGDDKVTVLHMAAAQDSWNVDSLRPLFNYGKRHLDAKDREGLAPIHHAARHGRSAMIEALRDAGANMAATDKQGRTTMHFAVRTMWASQIEDVFGKFLRPGAEHKVNIPDNDGWTPLHWACMINDANLINLLLNLCETDTSRRDLILQEQKHRWTALAIAEFCGTDENREALLAALERLRAAGVEGIPTDLPAVKRAKTHDNHWCDDCRIVVRDPFHPLSLTDCSLTGKSWRRLFHVCIYSLLTRSLNCPTAYSRAAFQMRH
jgi:ankyrin repeat protein